MWDVLSLLDHYIKYKKWDILIHQSIFTLDYAKCHVECLHKVSKADNYVVQNLKWSGAYLKRTFPYALVQKVIKLVPLTEAGK